MRLGPAFVLLAVLLVGSGCGGNAETEGESAQIAHVFYGPTWSPDGKTIAFIAGRSDTPSVVGLVRVDGTGLRSLGEQSPGIDTLAFSPKRSELLVRTTDGEVPGFETGEILRLSVPEGTETNLSNHRADDTDPAWSPDGELVAFSSVRSGSFDVFLVDHSGGGLRPLTQGTGADRFPRWSPDGRRLVVRRSRRSNDPSELNAREELVVIDVRSGRSRVVARFHPTEDLNASSWHAEWALNGRLLVTDIGARITIVDVGSGSRRSLPFFATEPRVSPDGRRLLVDGHREGKPPCPYTCVEEAGLFVIDLESGRSSLLFKQAPRYAIDASWSPDGRRIAFVLVTGSTSAERGLFVGRANGTALHPLVR